MDNRLAIKIAGSFHSTTGIEFEELRQEAELAYWLAETDGHYDPYKSAFSTFAVTCITRHLSGYTDAYKRKFPNHGELFEWSAFDSSPSPEDQLEFKELIKSLPDDARMIVELILSDAVLFAGLSPMRAYSEIAERLSSWTANRRAVAWRRVKRFLQDRHKVCTPVYGFTRGA